MRKDGRYIFINKNGDIVIPIEYDDARSFSGGLAVVEKDGKWGILQIVE